MSPTREPKPISAVSAAEDAGLSETVARAMTSAREAQVRWAGTSLARRLHLIRKLRQLIAENALQLADASASARRRPALESLTAEVMPLAEACRYVERAAKKILAPRRVGGRGRPLWLAGVRSEIHRVPFGVILLIGPGNYPLLLPGVQMIQALVAGNAVLLKPGVGGTAAARGLCDLMVRAGFDPLLFALLPESADAARTAIFARPDKVLFTGSAEAGEKILSQLAPHLIPATMELSGCDAVIVRADADLELVAKALTFGLTFNAGATCLAPKRVFVHRSLATEIEGRLAHAFHDRERQAAQGALGLAAVEKLRPLVDEAVALGAHFITGELQGAAPIILAGVSPASRLLREDVFGPVLSIVTVADDHEAILRANDCPFALSASIFSREESVARCLAEQIRVGVVTINDLILPTADARLPFGGRGRSGFGVTRGAEGLLELTTPKVITVTRGSFRPAFDPPQTGDEKLFQAYLRIVHGRGLKARAAALFALAGILRRKRAKPSVKK